MNNTSSTLINKRIGASLLISAFLTVFSMLQHPQGLPEDVYQKRSAEMGAWQFNIPINL